MNENEQRKLDSVFGRVHVVQPGKGRIVPLNPPPPPPNTPIALKDAPKDIRVAPRHETSPVLAMLKGTLPVLEEKKLSQPAPKDPSS